MCNEASAAGRVCPLVALEGGDPDSVVHEVVARRDRVKYELLFGVFGGGAETKC